MVTLPLPIAFCPEAIDLKSGLLVKESARDDVTSWCREFRLEIGDSPFDSAAHNFVFAEFDGFLVVDFVISYRLVFGQCPLRQTEHSHFLLRSKRAASDSKR